MTQLPTLQKGKKPIDTLPLPDVIGIVSSARELEPNNWSLSVPVLMWDAGYARKSLDVRLTESQANKLKAIQLGLEAKDAKLENGRCVGNPVDAVRWMLENVG